MPPSTLTVTQAAARLGVSPRLVRRWIAQGRVPLVPSLDGRRVPAADVRKIAARRNLGRWDRRFAGNKSASPVNSGV
jgi:excisionase family DNA binding protein